MNQGAGRVHQQATGLYIPGLDFQNSPLKRRQLLHLGNVFIADIRLFADNAIAGTGCIHNDSIVAVVPFRTEPGGILLHGGNTET